MNNFLLRGCRCRSRGRFLLTAAQDGLKSEAMSNRYAVLMDNPQAVEDFVRPFTAAFVVPGEPGARARVIGSGALVAIDHRRFVFTAGHCVRDAAEHPVLIPYPHSHVLRETAYDLRRGYCSSIDVGYFELPIVVWRTLEAEGYVFMHHRRLFVDKAAMLTEDDDCYVISGFPRALSVSPDPQAERFRFAIVATNVAAHRPGVPSVLTAPPGVEAIHLVIDGRIPTVNLRSASHEAVRLPDLGGMSGGPCWKGFIQCDPSDWAAARLRMVGVHVARVTSGFEIDPEQWRFARSILVGHHLRLIARDFPDLADFIFSTWGALTTWTEPALL